MLLISAVDFQIFNSDTDELSPPFKAGEAIIPNESTRPWLCSILRFCKGLVRIK